MLQMYINKNNEEPPEYILQHFINHTNLYTYTHLHDATDERQEII